MKKFYKVIMLFLALVLTISSSSLLVSCGATSVNQAQGVSFVSSMQDEDGIAVFELDLGVSVKLPYKINPSSAYGYTPRFTAVKGIDGDNLERFSLDRTTGEFCIKKSDFNPVKVEISIGDEYTAQCWIKLKVYPTAIGLYDESQFNQLNLSPKISLSTGSAYQINVAAIYEDSEVIDETTGEQKATLLKDSDYNFFVEVDEGSKTIIAAPNTARLNITAYDNYGAATVRVAICNYYGEVITNEDGTAKLAFEMEIDVYLVCESIDVKISSANRIVSSKSEDKTLYLTVTNLEKDAETGKYYLYYEVDFYDKYDRLIENDNLSVKCFVDKTTYITVDNDESRLIISRPTAGGTLEFVIEVWTNASLVSGEFCMTEVTVSLAF